MAGFTVRIAGMVKSVIGPVNRVVAVGALPRPVSARRDMAAGAVGITSVIEGDLVPILHVMAQGALVGVVRIWRLVAGQAVKGGFVMPIINRDPVTGDVAF
jgi:hypothetical protein